MYDEVGEQFFVDLVDHFYDGVASDDVLIVLYPEQDDLSGARERLRLFLIQYWGGPTTYSDERGHPRLRQRHFPFVIGERERDHWLVHMNSAIDATCAERGSDESVRQRLRDYMTNAANHMVNA
ncbi:MAG: globin, partial [Ilumatobacteraceae bacterium]|jgi:hemoglobin